MIKQLRIRNFLYTENPIYVEAWDTMLEGDKIAISNSFDSLLKNHDLSVDGFFDLFLSKDDRFVVPLQKLQRIKKIDNILNEK